MAGRHWKSADRRRVAIVALKCGLIAGKGLNPFSRFLGYFITVARNASQKRHIGVNHRLQIAILRDSDMTGHAIADRMFFLLMVKLKRISFDLSRISVRNGRAVTAGTVCPNRLNALKMTGETRRVTARIILEKQSLWSKAVDQCITERLLTCWCAGNKFRGRRACLMTDRAVIKLRFVIVDAGDAGGCKTGIDEMGDRYTRFLYVSGDYVLVDIVRKDRIELLQTARARERKTGSPARRNVRYVA